MGKRQTKPTLPVYAGNHTAPMLLIDSDGRLFDCNPAASNLFNVSKKDIGKKILSDFLKVAHKTFKLKSTAAGTNYGIFRHLKRQLSFRVFGYPLNARPRYHVLELTQTKKTRQLLQVKRGSPPDVEKANEIIRQKEEQLWAITQNLPSIVLFQFLLNPAGDVSRFPYMSESAINLFGVSAKDLVRDSAHGFDLIHPDDISYVMETMSHSRATLRDYDVTHRILVKGETKWVTTRSRPTKLADGSILWDGATLDITDKKLALDQIRNSEKFYESLIKSQTSLLIRTDMDGYYTFVNQRFLDHFGFEESDVLGRHSFETIHPEDRVICERAVMACVATPGKVVKAAFRKPNKKNDYFWTDWEFVAIKNEKGELTDIQCFGYDITEQFESRKKLESVAQRLSVATQAATLGIWEYNPVTLENVWDHRMFEIFGITQTTEISFAKFKSWIHPEDWPTVKSNLLETQAIPINFVYRIIRQSDKSLRYIQAFGTHHNNSNSLIGVNIDVTEKIEIENQLRQTANRLSLATKSAKIGVWDWDLNTNAIRWDPMMFELYGWDEKSGRESFERFNECIYPDDRAMVASLTSEVIAKKSSVDSSFRIVRQSDKSVRYMKSFGDLDVVRNMYTGVNIDVTDLIEKENFISQAKLQIEQLQLSALRSAMNPHFIFNALNSIQFFITQNQRENAIGYLSKFSRLIRGILDSTTAKKSTVASELELIKYYVEIEQLRFEHRFDFHLKVQHGLDTEMIELPALMLQPFVENAILHGLHTKKDRGLLEIEVTEAAEAYCITISDNGIGREAAMEIQRANFPDHKSKGLQLNAERVEIINHRRSIKVAVNDLKSNGKACGTRVQIIVAKG